MINHLTPSSLHTHLYLAHWIRKHSHPTRQNQFATERRDHVLRIAYKSGTERRRSRCAPIPTPYIHDCLKRVKNIRKNLSTLLHPFLRSVVRSIQVAVLSTMDFRTKKRKYWMNKITCLPLHSLVHYKINR